MSLQAACRKSLASFGGFLSVVPYLEHTSIFFNGGLDRFQRSRVLPGWWVAAELLASPRPVRFGGQ